MQPVLRLVLCCTQVVLSWRGSAGRNVTRVVTRRLKVTASAAAFLRDVQPVTASALIAKRMALEAVRTGAAGDATALNNLARTAGAGLSSLAHRRAFMNHNVVSQTEYIHSHKLIDDLH